MAELYGKIEGCSHGYGGSMHLYDVEVGNLGANAVVAGGIPGIVGAALAFQMRDEKRIAVAFFGGGGATNAGTFHESLNLAQVWKVPAIFVLENNGWAESTPAKQHLPLPVDELGRRAHAYGMKLIEADGQDVEAVYLAALAAREHALSGAGPVPSPAHLPSDGPLHRRRAGLSRQGRDQEDERDEGPDRASSCAHRALRRGLRGPRGGDRSRGRGIGRVREGGNRSQARRCARLRLRACPKNGSGRLACVTRHDAASSVAPICLHIGAPCVLASRRVPRAIHRDHPPDRRVCLS